MIVFPGIPLWSLLTKAAFPWCYFVSLVVNAFGCGFVALCLSGTKVLSPVAAAVQPRRIPI